MVHLRIALVALVLSAVAICASSRLTDAGAASTLSGAPHALKIVAFGSSSTQGVGASGPPRPIPRSSR